MMSSNGLTIYKNKRLSFINKSIILLLLVLLSVIILCSYFTFKYWSEMPIIIKMFWPILLVIILGMTIITPFNGMLITKKGTIFFLPDFRFKKFKAKDLSRIAITFNEWENNKYSAAVKFVYRDGKVFNKDYSKQFKDMKNNKLTMSMYTISKRQVESICNALLDLNFCIVTVIDKSGHIAYQSKINPNA